MKTENCTSYTRTVAITLTARQQAAFDAMIKHHALKKMVYLRNLVVADLVKNGWLSPEEETKPPYTVAMEG